MSRQPDPQPMIDALSAPLPEATFSFYCLGDTRWQVLRFDGREALSEGFTFTLELASADLSHDPDALLDAAAELTLGRAGHERTVSGLVCAVADLGVAHGHRLARVTLVPELWCLSERFDSRVFVDRTAVELAREVLRLADLYVGRLDVHVTRTLPTHEYLVQYRESDLDFVKRWLEREGVTFFVRHDPVRGEVLVLSDHPEPWAETPTLDGAPVALAGAEGATHRAETFRSWQWERRLTITSALVADHDWTRPSYDPNASGRPRSGRRVRRECGPGLALGGYGEREAHAYATDDAAAQSAMRMDAAGVRSRVATAKGNVTGLAAGQRLTVHGAEGDEVAALVVAVTHAGHAPEVLTGRAGERADEARYENTAVCIPRAQRFRPERVTPWPRVSGVELARVEGPDPQAPATEFHGRVKVRFCWDERAESPRAASCFVPVVQTWAGSRYGFTFIPRAGMEVAVDFVGGDPDRPIVVGAVYTGENRHAEELPQHRSRSGIRTASLDDVTRYNELVFDDETHREEVFLRAQRNLREQVLSDHLATVGHDRVETIGHDHRLHIKRNEDNLIEGMRDTIVHCDETLTVNRDRIESVMGRESISVGSQSVAVGDVALQTPAPGCQTVMIAGDHEMDVGQTLTTDCTTRNDGTVTRWTATAQEMIFEASTRISFRVGSTHVEITQEGIRMIGLESVHLGTTHGAMVEARGEDVLMHSHAGANIALRGLLAKINA